MSNRGTARVIFMVAVAAQSLAWAETAAPAVKAQFMSTVQWAVQEPNVELTQRGQKLVVEQFDNSLDSWPELHGKHFEVHTAGNEVTFYLVTGEDMRSPMQHAVASMIQNLNGRVRARGRSAFYRTALSQPMGAYLETVVDDTHSRVLSISAQSVPLRDLLKEIKSQLGTLSYLIPGECAERLVDWSFGGKNNNQPKMVDTVMSELATLFNLKQEKKNGTYIFSGECHDMVPAVVRRPIPAEFQQAGFIQTGTGSSLQSPQVILPMIPLGD